MEFTETEKILAEMVKYACLGGDSCYLCKDKCNAIFERKIPGEMEPEVIIKKVKEYEEERRNGKKPV